MFGRLRQKNILTGFLLVGFCLYVVQLYLEDNIILYIHPRYTLFAFGMCLVALVILVSGIVMNVRRRGHHEAWHTVGVVDMLAVVVLGLALLMPAQALSSETIERKSVNTPTPRVETADQEQVTCLEEEPASIETWVYVISNYPPKCYEGRPIELTGFVITPSENPLPKDMYYLGRTVISCCVVDARPYAIPIAKGKFQAYPAQTWLTVKGRLKTVSVNGSPKVVIEPQSVTPTQDPSKPYDYIGTPSNTNIHVLQPVQ